jgi:Na+/H+ antiporter NhaD/arsenite permease-like protein
VTALQIFSLALLFLAFVIAIWRDINVGLVTIPAAFVLALVAHVPVKALYGGFPTSLVILVLGVMYLFGHADRSGALVRIVRGAERIVGRRIWLLSWMGFLLGAAISSMGALPGATVAIVMPITMEAARRRGINPMLMGLITIFGALAGGFSPISVFAILLRELSSKEQYSIPLPQLYVFEFVLYAVAAVVAFVIYGRHRSLSAGASHARNPYPDAVTVPASDVGSVADVTGQWRAYEIGSLIAIFVFVVGVLAFGLDVGLTAFALGAALHIAFRIDTTKVVAALPWGVALILAGLLTYISILLKLGTFTVLADSLQQYGNAAVIALLLAYFAAFFSSFESSSVTVLAVSIPMVLKVEAGLPSDVLFSVVGAVAFCAAVISTSPFHVNGALMVANGSHGDPARAERLFRGLLLWTVAAALVAPLVTWLIPLAGGLR